MKYMEKFEPSVLENRSVEDKVNYLVRLAKILAISAIMAGIVGMLISNMSIRSLNVLTLEPLGNLRSIEESYQQRVLIAAQNIAQGKITNYVQTANELIIEKENIVHAWNSYKKGSLTKEEIRLLPEAEKYMQLSLDSLDTLIVLVREKKLIQIISWITDDAPYTILEINPIINKLMQIEIVNAQNIYATTQKEFFGILAVIVLISLLGSWYMRREVERIISDLTLPFVELLDQSKALAKHNLSKPFVWKRTDEIGQVGKSLELTRQALNDSLQQIQLKNKELIQQSRLAKMGEMISMIAHQWRQPLGAIASTTLNLKLKIETESFDLNTKDGRVMFNDYFGERLNRIEEYVYSLTTTIDDFRNFYKPDKKLVQSSLKQVTYKALKIIRNSMEVENIEIKEEYLDEIQCELLDNELTQVILNILKNSQDNFREKGIKNPCIKIKGQNNSLFICDNGGGIPEEIIENIFDPYFSTKDEKNGTGLGLHMSRVIVEEHHRGKLRVKNNNNGVCFEIKLESN